jgi:hypothetical protein
MWGKSLRLIGLTTYWCVQFHAFSRLFFTVAAAFILTKWRTNGKVDYFPPSEEKAVRGRSLTI